MTKSSFFTGLLVSILFSAVTLGAVNVTGRWSGTMKLKSKDSESAYLILKQDGDKLSGSAGPGESEQRPFEGGKVEGNKLTFDVSLGGGPGSFHFDLQVQRDQLTGQVRRTGEGLNEAGKISVKRVAEK